MNETTMPAVVTSARADEIRALAAAKVGDLKANPGNRQLADAIANVGQAAQTTAAHTMELLKPRVGRLLKSIQASGGDTTLVDGLLRLRTTLGEISPYVSKPTLGQRLFYWFPGVNLVVDRLRQVGARLETAEQQITGIIATLETGKRSLEQDNQELTELYDKLATAQIALGENMYLAELLVQLLRDEISVATDNQARNNLTAVLELAVVRQQVLNKLALANEQFLAEIDLEVKTNKKLVAAVANTVDVAPNVLRVGLAIQASLIRQSKVAQATAAVDQFVSDALVENAKLVGQNTKEVDALFKGGVLAMDKLVEAQNILFKALNDHETECRAAIDAGEQVNAKLKAMTDELARRRPGAETTQTSSYASLEARAML